MSDPHVVMVSIDFAPWDSDVTAELRLFEFSGPVEADHFYASATILANVNNDELIVGVWEPEPIHRFGDSDAALMALRDWISEAE